MPVLNNTTGIDNIGRLRSYTIYNCDNCGVECKTRNDVFERRKGICKKCLLEKIAIKNQSNKDFEIVCSNLLHSQLNRRYSKKGFFCNIKGEKLLKLLKSNCHYCNSTPSNLMKYKQKYYNYEFSYNGLDRIDSSKGYIYENVVPCCKKCNLAKSDMSYQDFINHIKKIYKNITNANL